MELFSSLTSKLVGAAIILCVSLYSIQTYRLHNAQQELAKTKFLYTALSSSLQKANLENKKVQTSEKYKIQSINNMKLSGDTLTQINQAFEQMRQASFEAVGNNLSTADNSLA